MSTKVLLKKSSVLGKVPLATDLSYGELALNYADGKLYFKDTSNNIQSFDSAPQLSISSLTDVDTTTTAPNIGQVLKWNGTNWVPGNDETVGGGTSDADTLDGFDSSYFLNYNNLTNKPTIPTVPTNVSAFTNDSNYATTTYVDNAVASFSNPNLTNINSIEFGNSLIIDGTVDNSVNQLVVIDSFPIASYRTAKYTIQATSGIDIHSTEILLTHNDIDAFITEYAVMYSSSSLMTITAEVDGTGTVRLLANTGISPTVIDFTRTSLKARDLSGLSGDLQSSSGTEDLQSSSGSVDLNV